jgi:hypothetical protein
MKWILLGIIGLAAYAGYMYATMSEEEKKDMANKLKEKGKKLYDDYVPENMKSKIAQV